MGTTFAAYVQSCRRPMMCRRLRHQRVSDCIDELSTGLQFNPIKTEVLWCLSARQIPTRQVRLGKLVVLPQPAIRDHVVYIDTDVTMSAHVTVTIRACFAALRGVCGRYIVCGIRWCNMPCWHWSAPQSLQSSTSAVVQCWLVCLDCWCGFSPR